ncbi:unnamed protein product [Blepharisma stoltei]|uniref:RRM domain-containing protein n=1 Tax=Blepharisma stoltei TaxID=1481888 RepID=A0AAU9IX17_9CILI|nr:unnamed protein product [Blepharisma stoltei]
MAEENKTSKDVKDEGKGQEQEHEEVDEDAELRSIFVGNVHFRTTKEELTEFFKECGEIKRITILQDKFTGQPKGFAYVEFADKESVQSALAYNDATFNSRQIKVLPKRKNLPLKYPPSRFHAYPRRGRFFSRGRFRYRPY